MGRRLMIPATPPPTRRHLAIGDGNNRRHLAPPVGGEGAAGAPGGSRLLAAAATSTNTRGPEMKLSVEATQDIQADIRRLDAAIDWAERAWGRGRLPSLVPSAMAAKVTTQQGRVYDALSTGDPDLVRKHIDSLIAGYTAMSKAAADAGHQEIEPQRMEAVMSDGSLLVICASTADLAGENRRAHVMTMDSAAKIFESWMKQNSAQAVGAVMREFPGATVEAITPIDWKVGDEIPF